MQLLYAGPTPKLTNQLTTKAKKRQQGYHDANEGGIQKRKQERLEKVDAAKEKKPLKFSSTTYYVDLHEVFTIGSGTKEDPYLIIVSLCGLFLKNDFTMPPATLCLGGLYPPVDGEAAVYSHYSSSINMVFKKASTMKSVLTQFGHLSLPPNAKKSGVCKKIDSAYDWALVGTACKGNHIFELACADFFTDLV